jgi:cytidine deaminase
MEHAELIRLAQEARHMAYAPYSGFKVGACLLAPDQTVYTGANVENASYGLTVCAERIAVFKAVTAGQKSFSALAVAGSGEDMIIPCGACLQVLREFSADLQLLLTDGQGNCHLYRLEEFLPLAFQLSKGKG